MIRQILTIVAAALAIQVSADNYREMKALTLEEPEMKAELVLPTEQPAANYDLKVPEANHKMDFDFFKSKTAPGVKAYKFLDDMTFVGIPLFVAGLALKGDKAMFRVNQKAEQGGKKNTQLLTDFKTGIDDYTQFFGPAAVVGLKLAGYEGRSDWPRLLASAGMSYGLMALTVNVIKNSAKEMRPDGSSANSWPSGHTATAFAGATILHKEYGLTRSPWFSVAGYGVATATGVMRVLNNRHWVSDVMSGAGIGILAGELGYALGDLLFKEKGLLRNDLEFNSEKPTFFSVSMGLGLGSKDLDFSDGDESMNIKFRAATVVDAEGAYFFNKYIGVGGRLRVRAMSAKDFGDFAKYVAVEDYDAWEGMMGMYKKHFPDQYPAAATPEAQYDQDWTIYMKKVGYDLGTETPNMSNAPVTNIYGTVKSDHITEFTGSVGLYFNLPLSKHFALGSKALIGRSFTQELDIDGHAEGNKKDIKYQLAIDNTVNGNPSANLTSLEYPTNTGEQWTDDWDYLTVGSETSTSFGTGLSLTYKYKSNFSWRLYFDYDYTRKNYTARYDPFHFTQNGLTPGANYLMDFAADYGDNQGLSVREYKLKKNMHYFTMGLSFLVNI